MHTFRAGAFFPPNQQENGYGEQTHQYHCSDDAPGDDDRCAETFLTTCKSMIKKVAKNAIRQAMANETRNMMNNVTEKVMKLT